MQSSIPTDGDWDIPDDGQPITVPRNVALLIRWERIKLLNTLETVLAPWRHNIADREMLREELRYLVVPEQGHNRLAGFRAAAGGAKNFPAIQEFVEELESDHALTKGKKRPA